MKKIQIILTFLLMLSLYSCSDTTTDSANNYSCIQLKINNYWLYNIKTDNSEQKKKFIISEIVEKEVEGIKKNVFKIYDNFNNYYWYLFSEGSTLWFSSENKFEPLISNTSSCECKNVWLKFSFCQATSFSNKTDNYENVSIYDYSKDSVVQGKFRTTFQINCSYQGKEIINIKNENINANVFNCTYKSWEEIVEPKNVTFEDSTRIRNVQEFNFKVWFTAGIGFIRIEENGIIKELIDYGIE